MKSRLLKCLPWCYLLASITPPLRAGVAYSDPPGGWTYIFNGDKDTAGADGSGFTSLDGTWSHDNIGDVWDGSKIGGAFTPGVNSPGGVMSITEGNVTFLRIQDTGNPSQYGCTIDPASGEKKCPYVDPLPGSNRKIYLSHDLTAQGVSDTFMDDGVTLSFRARVPTPKKATGPLDPIYRHGGADDGPKPYPDAGDGTLINDQGFSNVYISQPRGLGSVGFALTVPQDNFTGNPEDTTSDFSGLIMNRFDGVDIKAAIGFSGPGEFRGIALDPSDWHEFWIQVKKDKTEMGNFEVSVFADGSTTPTVFIVTGGDGSKVIDTEISALGIGGTKTVESWALDLDFVAIKPGLVAPVASRPRIEIARDGARVKLTFTGKLQSMDTVKGQWADVPNAVSPFSADAAGSQKYFRSAR
ncbi:MAG: hypothetical protein FJW39_34550 [Acidobacteria bacterium]|nr:hypothetical protein [Acidobacteriota bacterium]